MEDTSEHISDSSPEAEPARDAEPAPLSGEGEALRLVQDFLTHFVTTVEKSDRESKLRATKAGFFLEETLLSPLIAEFQSWFKSKSTNATVLSEDKIFRKLFNEETPILSYVLEGKHSMIGYVVPVQMKQPQKSGVQLYHGQPLDALNYLHPRDPFIDQLPNTKTAMGKQGLEFQFAIGTRTYLVTMPQLVDFAHMARGSRRVCTDYPKLNAALREALLVLPKLLAKARPSRKKIPLLVPAQFRADKQAIFLCVGSFVFILNRDGHLQYCYDLKGKNRHEFVTAEFEMVRRMRKGPRVDGLELERSSKSRFVAYFKLQGQRYQLLPKAFGDFVEAVPHVPEFEKKLAPFFTLFDCVKTCAEVFMQSSIVDSRDSSKYLRDKRYSDVLYLRISKGFVFVISKKHVVLDCFPKEGQRRGKQFAAKTRS